MGPEAAEIARRQLGAGGSGAALVKGQAFGGYALRLGVGGPSAPGATELVVGGAGPRGLPWE